MPYPQRPDCLRALGLNPPTSRREGRAVDADAVDTHDVQLH
jgi:hypothetical protein